MVALAFQPVPPSFGSYQDEVQSELDHIVRERVDTLWKMGITGADLVIAAVGAGEAIVFTYGQNVELDGQNGLSSGSRALVEKKKGKYRLYDFTERGDDEKLGMPGDDGTPAPLIDSLHRILWLIENEPRNLNRFLDEARPDRERLRLVAQALAGTALEGKKDDGADHLVTTTASEQAALKKLVANWHALIETRLSNMDIKTGQRKMFD